MHARRKFVILLAAVTVAAFNLAAPVSAQETQEAGGTVGATVTVADDAGACIAIGTTAVDFGTLPFSTTGAASRAVSVQYSVANCGASGVDVMVRGTDAAGDAGATWNLTTDTSFSSDCAQLEVFTVDVLDEAVGSGAPLDTVDQPLAALAEAASLNVDHELVMPCQGSSGAGQTMAFDILYTAVAA